MDSEMYDAFDMRDSYRTGFWIGTVAGIIGTFTLCLAVGLFIAS